MNKVYKVLATTTLLAMMAMPIAASAHPSEAHKQVSQGKHDEKQKENKSNKKHQQDKYSHGTEGTIVQYIQGKEGRYITVKGKGINQGDQNEIILGITDDTKIVDEKGKKVNLEQIVKDKLTVKAYYGDKLTKSIPPRGVAEKIVVQKKQLNSIVGQVTEVNNQAIRVVGKDFISSNKSEMILQISNNTKIVDANGKTLTKEDIHANANVQAYYGASSKSLPPRAVADYIIVNDQVNTAGTSGVIMYKNDNGAITVVGKGVGGSSTNYVVANITDKTVIVDQKGNKLTRDSLKPNMKVEVYYGPVMAMSFPPMVGADRVVVSAETSQSQGTVNFAVKNDQLSLVHLDVKSDNDLNNDVILNVTKDTVIISLSGAQVNFDNLKNGVKVTAYYAPTNKALPALANADVLVLE